MASRVSQNESGVKLPDVVPLDIGCMTRLSWELGSRVVDDEESTLHGEWTHAGTRWTLSLYRVTSNTDIVRLRTPVGREQFYGAVRADVRSALPSLEASSSWRPCE